VAGRLAASARHPTSPRGAEADSAPCEEKTCTRPTRCESEITLQTRATNLFHPKVHLNLEHVSPACRYSCDLFRVTKSASNNY
jgi:hypothetical protein